MARNKKSKRPNLPQETLERARAELRGEVYIADSDIDADDEPEVRPVAKAKAATSAPVAPVAKPKRQSTNTTRRIPTIEDLLSDYKYVLRDLRHLAILAISLFVAIIVVSFVLAHV